MHFIFVPGPSDPYDVSNLLLPRRALPNSLIKDIKSKLPKVTFASNPCRILYKSQEIVVFREDLMSRMLRNIVSLKNDLSALANQQLQEELAEQEIENVSDETMADARKKILSQFVSDLSSPRLLRLRVVYCRQLVQTILDQSHLAPLPLQVRPVLWEFDQSLRLFPLPTTVSLQPSITVYATKSVAEESCPTGHSCGQIPALRSDV